MIILHMPDIMAISAMSIVLLTMSSWTVSVTSVSVKEQNKSLDKRKLEIKATDRLLTGPIQSGTEIAGNIISSLGNGMINYNFVVMFSKIAIDLLYVVIFEETHVSIFQFLQCLVIIQNRCSTTRIQKTSRR